VQTNPEAFYTAVIADALDRLGLRNQTLDPAIRPLYAKARVTGTALPVVIESREQVSDPPYDEQMQVIEAIAPGDVLVIQVEPGVTAATWGELFSCAARGRGALGVVTDGNIRDAEQIEELAFPVFTRGYSPLDTLGRAEVSHYNKEACCGGVRVRPGDRIFADGDGVVVVPREAIDEVLTIAREKGGKEMDSRADLLAGASVREVWQRYGVF
jgi:regulator of RNase E activity RraA